MFGPIYVVQFVAFDAYAARRIRRLRPPAGSSPPALARFFDRLHIAAQDVRGRFDILDAPAYARPAADAYSDLLFDLELATEKTAEELEHRRTITAAYAAKVDRRLTRPARAEPRRLRRLIAVLRRHLPGAAPPKAEPA